MSIRSAILVPLATVAVVACAGSGEVQPQPATLSEEMSVDVNGRIEATWSVGRCGSAAAEFGEALADSFVGARLTFRDGDGNVVGVTTTEESSSEPGSEGCIFFSEYDVQLMRADFYQVEYDIEDWRNSSDEQPISHEELEQMNYQWIIDLGVF
jgi:hypothetical protein